ncbi:hypothetical protein [Pseudomonas mediterranea]|jgi:hypothetical protein|uniref:Uncharacterized protein n=1 Tax=Pseudomonas mediterranea TaxID=183795 RepID=A0AAX2DIY7_9PSED|nr:hypothetical protein [Pseudomonas mediterranea]KGU84814.1 hypothetical protein N005_15735 [Pseudomonas mediterranea CFBP 5447]SDU74566.1 hypothetical protein SAMN05216476_5239 [Pseudomonas mediterranea]
MQFIKKLFSDLCRVIANGEDPYDQFREEFEAGLPQDSLSRDSSGNYTDPVTARKWEQLRKDRLDEVMAQW